MFLFAFDLIELNGQDLRREPIEIRQRQLATLLRAARVVPSPATSCSSTPTRAPPSAMCHSVTPTDPNRPTTTRYQQHSLQLSAPPQPRGFQQRLRRREWWLVS